METANMPGRSNNSSVSNGLQNVMDRYETDQKAIRYNGNIVSELFESATFVVYTSLLCVVEDGKTPTNETKNDLNKIIIAACK